MRSNGTSEDHVTGGADPFVKFTELAKALEMSIGNPMYHWCNLELKKYFGINEPLTVDNAKQIWDRSDGPRHHQKVQCRFHRHDR